MRFEIFDERGRLIETGLINDNSGYHYSGNNLDYGNTLKIYTTEGVISLIPSEWLQFDTEPNVK